MIQASEITDLHRRTVELWHRRPIANPHDGFLGLVCEQHKFNYLLWHEEDIARSPDVGDERIAQVKRAIDRYNQLRNDHIERLDDHLVAELARRGVVHAPDARYNTETPGSVIDRLSIIALRIYHMQEQADRVDVGEDHRRKALSKLAILRIQLSDLEAGLDELAADLVAGRKQLRVYRQFKMYNDPSLNPWIYQGRQQQAG